MKFEVLSPGIASSAEKWREILSSLPSNRRDVHYLPEYTQLCAGEGSTPFAAVYRSGRGVVLYPFLSRNITIGGKIAEIDGSAAKEIVAPYGLGGPVCSCEGHVGHALYKEFDAAFVQWCNEEKYASEFLCPHLFSGSLDNILANPYFTYVTRKSIVCISLDGNEGDLKRQCNKGHKYAINLAKRNAVDIERVDTPNHSEYAAMLEIYYATMQRQNAAQRWYVRHEYFSDCRDMLGSNHCCFYLARLDSAIVAWNIMMLDGQSMYYHFAGSTPEGQKVGAPAALVFRAACDAQAMGLRRLYLGGGATDEPEDPIFRFKHGFSKTEIPFYIAWRELTASSYSALCRMKLEHEQVVAYCPENPDFFPIYRR